MVPFIKPHFDIKDLMAVAEVMNSGWVAQGPRVEALEEAAAIYLGVRHVVSVTNCTSALILALMALDIGSGDEVIVPDFTFPATAIAVAGVGARPVLVDVNPKTYNIDACSVKAAITKRTAGIMPVHQFGLFYEDLDRIMVMAEDNDLWVIEDAACALGAKSAFSSRMAGTIGDIGCFSLHASKGITAGEGGLICTDSDMLAERLRRLSCFGDERAFRRSKNKSPFMFNPHAGNYKMSDIVAAIALSQLGKIERLIEWRIKIAGEWGQVIFEDPFLRENIISVPQWIDDHSHIYQSYVVVCKEGKRPDVMDYFRQHGFQTGIGTHACHRYEALEDLDNAAHSLINADYLHENAVSLPRYYGLEVKKEWEGSSGK